MLRIGDTYTISGTYQSETILQWIKRKLQRRPRKLAVFTVTGVWPSEPIIDEDDEPEPIIVGAYGAD